VHGTKICLAADVEAHRGRDGRLYMLDFGRLFPPEAPQQGFALFSVLFLVGRFRR
jgi:hypothetical protein